MWKHTLISDTRKKYGTRAMACAITVGMLFLFFGKKDICRGLVLGSVFSVLNFVLICQSLQTRIEMTKKKATLFALGNIVFRYTAMAVPLFVAIKLDRFNIFGTITGLFTVQIAILADHLPKKFFLPKN